MHVTRFSIIAFILQNQHSEDLPTYLSVYKISNYGMGYIITNMEVGFLVESRFELKC